MPFRAVTLFSFVAGALSFGTRAFEAADIPCKPVVYGPNGPPGSKLRDRASAPLLPRNSAVVMESQDFRYPPEQYKDVLTLPFGDFGQPATPLLHSVVYYPADIADMEGTLPLAVFLHGQHAVCGQNFFLDGEPVRIDGFCAPVADDREGAEPNTVQCSDSSDNGDATDNGDGDSLSDGDGDEPNSCAVAPSYLGYEYLARPLVENGFVVMSVDTNNLTWVANSQAAANFYNYCDANNITKCDTGLWWTRGLLMLKNIEVLSHYNRGIPANNGVNSNDPAVAANNLALAQLLEGKLDMDRVAFMGHSRGGEGVRYAYNAFTGALPSSTSVPFSKWSSEESIGPMTIRGVMEVAPTDVLGTQVENTNWAALVPLCDGDVVDLAGRNPYYRMAASNITLGGEVGDHMRGIVWVSGANHNLLNTEWNLLLDSDACPNRPLMSKLDAQEYAVNIVGNFIVGSAKRDSEQYLQQFNPSFKFSLDAEDDSSNVGRAYIGTLAPANTIYLMQKLIQLNSMAMSQSPFYVTDWTSLGPQTPFAGGAPSCYAAASSLITTDTEDEQFLSIPFSYNLNTGLGNEAADIIKTTMDGSATTGTLKEAVAAARESILQQPKAKFVFSVTPQEVRAFEYLYMDVAPSFGTLNQKGWTNFRIVMSFPLNNGNDDDDDPGDSSEAHVASALQSAVNASDYASFDTANPTFTGIEFLNIITLRIPLSDFGLEELPTEENDEDRVTQILLYAGKTTLSASIALSSLRLATV